MTEAPLTMPPAAARRLDFGFAGIAFSCHLDPGLYPRQRRHLESYLPLEPVTPAVDTLTVRITASDPAYHRLLPPGPPPRLHTAFAGAPYGRWDRDGVSVYRPALGPGLDDHLFVVAPDRVDVVVRSDAANPQRFLRHILCEVTMPTWEDRGAAVFHAACAAREGAAVLITGAKGAGKSTTVATLATGGFMALCGNDRTIVDARTGSAVGLPLAYPLGNGLLHSDPALATLRDRGHPGPAGDPRAKQVFTPARLAGALGTRLGTGGRLRLVLLPRLSPDDRPFWHRPAAADEAAAELLASCYTPDDPAFRQPRFRPRRTPPDTLAANAERVCRELGRTVPAVRVGWGIGTGLEAARAQLRALVAGRLAG